jgi:hypothetical protein
LSVGVMTCLAFLLIGQGFDVQGFVNSLLNRHGPQTIAGIVMDSERCVGIPYAWVQVFTYTQGFSRKGDFGLSAESVYQCVCDSQGQFRAKISVAFGSMLVLAGHSGYGRAEFRIVPDHPLRIALGPVVRDAPKVRGQLVSIVAGRGVTQGGWRFADGSAVATGGSADVWFDWRDLAGRGVRVSAGRGARIQFLDAGRLCNSVSRLSAVCRAPADGYSSAIDLQGAGTSGLIIVLTEDGHVCKIDWDEDMVYELLKRRNALQMSAYYNSGAGDELCTERGPLRLQEGD